MSKASRAATIVPFLLVGIVLLMIVPLPPAALDLLLASSIATSVALLLVSINLEKPLDLSALPTLLLFTTLLRLALNVASTRLILLHGADGTQAAGRIVNAFGEFVVGGNAVVGAAIFILLVIINFVVITKGAGRVAEVSARFTLDACLANRCPSTRTWPTARSPTRKPRRVAWKSNAKPTSSAPWTARVSSSAGTPSRASS